MDINKHTCSRIMNYKLPAIVPYNVHCSVFCTISVFCVLHVAAEFLSIL